MNALFGKFRKKSAPKPYAGPSMGEISGKTDARVSQLEAKITECDKKLLPLKKKIKRSKGATQTRYKKQAMMILKRRKMFEKQLDQCSAMQLNQLSIVDAVDQAKNVQEMAAAMKETVTTLKAQQKEMNLDDIEDIYDDMDDIMLDQEEMQDVMSRSLGDMDDVDEDDLMAELEDVDDELEGLADADGTSYLDDVTMPVVPVDPVAAPSPSAGLPVIPTAAPAAAASLRA